MASLEQSRSIGQGYRLRFQIGKRRHSIGLDTLDESDAKIAKEHLEHLLDQQKRDRPPSPVTAAWLDRLPDAVHDRFAAFNLVEYRHRSELPRTVLAFMRAYIKSRTDWKKPENYRQSVDHLEAFLRRDVSLTSLTKGECERWLRWMTDQKNGPGLSPNTAGQHVKRCRQMIRQAVDEGLVEKNVLVGIKIDLRSDTSKNRYIDADMATAIMDACPDQEWRVIFALARYAGLRCPSEVLRLRWSNIDWDRNRFKVTSPKTDRYGKGERITLRWPELCTELNYWFELFGAIAGKQPLQTCDSDFAEPSIFIGTDAEEWLEKQGKECPGAVLKKPGGVTVDDNAASCRSALPTGASSGRAQYAPDDTVDGMIKYMLWRLHPPQRQLTGVAK